MVKLILKTPTEQIVLAEDTTSNLDQILPIGDDVSENEWVKLIEKIDHLKYVLPKVIARLANNEEMTAVDWDQITLQFMQLTSFELQDAFFLQEVSNLDTIIWKLYNNQRISIEFSQKQPALTIAFGAARPQQIF